MAASGRAGPQRATVWKNLQKIGEANEQAVVRASSKQLQDWAAKNPEDAERLWHLVAHGQVAALSGAAKVSAGSADKPLLKGTTSWKRLPKSDKKQALMDNYVVDAGCLRMLQKKQKDVEEQLFVFCTAMDPEAPIPPRMTHGWLACEIATRIEALGSRAQHFVVVDGAIDWEQCGPFAFIVGEANTIIQHQFSGAIVELGVDDASRQWFKLNWYDELAAAIDDGHGHRITASKLCDVSVFDYSSTELAVRKRKMAEKHVTTPTYALSAAAASSSRAPPQLLAIQEMQNTERNADQQLAQTTAPHLQDTHRSEGKLAQAMPLRFEETPSREGKVVAAVTPQLQEMPSMHGKVVVAMTPRLQEPQSGDGAQNVVTVTPRFEDTQSGDVAQVAYDTLVQAKRRRIIDDLEQL